MAKDLFGICPFVTSQKILQGKWAILVLHELSQGTRRFNELERGLQITHATLSSQLKSLEREGIVRRTVYPEVPPRVEYSLTDIGRKFAPVLESIRAWGTDYIDYLHANRLMGSGPTAALSIWSIDPVLKKRPDLPGEMASRAFFGWFGASRGIRCSRLSHVFVGGAVGRGIPLLP